VVEDLLRYVVNKGLESGASYVEARYQKDIHFAITSRNGAILSIGHDVKEGIGIRVLLEGTLAFASTNILSKEAVEYSLNKAISRARASSKVMRNPIRFSEERLGKVSYSVHAVKEFDYLSLDDKLNMHTELWKIVSSSVKETKIPVYFMNYVEHTQEKVIINSDGAYVRSLIPRVFIAANIVCTHPQKGSVQTWVEFGASGGLEWLNVWKVDKELKERTKVLEKILTKGVEPPKEKVDVVIGSEIVGLLVHESAGHPMEADRILGREAAQAGESYVKPYMIGKERIGTKYATVIEDPTIPGSFGFYLYDDEGVPARPRHLYKEGIINEPLHNRATAYVFGTSSNASARAMDYKSEPIIRMSNTYLKPGDMSFEELIEDVKLGVFIKNYMEWNIDDIRWNQRYVGLEAYLIKNGELKKLVRNPVLEITTKGFYSKIVGVDKNLKFYPGTCGKGEPAQGVPVWFGGPNVRLSKIYLGVVRA